MQFLNSGTCAACGEAFYGEHYSMALRCAACDQHGHFCQRCSGKRCLRCGAQLLDSWTDEKRSGQLAVLYMQPGVPSPVSVMVPASKTSAQINAEIYNHGVELFERIRNLVREHATQGTGKRGAPTTEQNRRTLDEAVQGVCTVPLGPHAADDLWQVFWRRIVYAGTRAQKATTEIASMETVWLFPSLRAYVPGGHVFARSEWEDFSGGWKRKVGKKDWLAIAKKHPDWLASLQVFVQTTTAEWQLMVKDQVRYPGLRFSSNAVKMEKYVCTAEVLSGIKQADALQHFTGGVVFSPNHPQGEEYLRERAVLAKVHEAFAALLGRITALHAMMDLGLKTVKPDRVMTYLFSQLGWLQTLPAHLGKRAVLDNYIRPEVIEEVRHRADVLAARLAEVGFANAHRLLDIWFVKFGQEAEYKFGITRNLQATTDGGIAGVYAGIRASARPALIGEQEAADRWPVPDFSEVHVRVREAGDEGDDFGDRATLAAPRGPRRAPRLSREEAERVFMEQWRLLHAAEPLAFPNRLDNEPKEAIIKRIVRGVPAEDAFLEVLETD